uniref:AlNc14C18G1838 protein n=1 Tax=Albugo laibachii Nc14 TaxID=890382 RepID=F0W4L7_9STRA|nr:AlNc14C18G1838 [Albugo laibachii Nc14]|eukprot:CCA16051.1 AlNc14C18G1838 [Albugo laibachii Nc14]
MTRLVCHRSCVPSLSRFAENIFYFYLYPLLLKCRLLLTGTPFPWTCLYLVQEFHAPSVTADPGTVLP